jgi:hypothetical protein
MGDANQSIAPIESDPGEERRERMQRVRIGLTGLAVVLLIVVVTTMLFARMGDAPANNSAVAVESENEPLADLGVAPGAPIDNKMETSPRPK